MIHEMAQRECFEPFYFMVKLTRRKFHLCNLITCLFRCHHDLFPCTACRGTFTDSDWSNLVFTSSYGCQAYQQNSRLVRYWLNSLNLTLLPVTGMSVRQCYMYHTTWLWLWSSHQNKSKKCSSQLEFLKTVILLVLQLLVKEFRHQEERGSKMNRTFELSFQYISYTVYLSET